MVVAPFRLKCLSNGVTKQGPENIAALVELKMNIVTVNLPKKYETNLA